MLNILFEDRDLIVVEKPVGVESQSARALAPDMVSQIRTHLRRTTHSADSYVGVIHRLDKPVRGVMVYAKNKKSAAALSAQLQNGQFHKFYSAVVIGAPDAPSGTFADYLAKDAKTNTAKFVDSDAPDAKPAKLSWTLQKTIVSPDFGTLSLLDVELFTGRFHQIRAQLSGHGLPILGDLRYGNISQETEKSRTGLSLCARELHFVHPTTKKEMIFSITPRHGAFAMF